MRDELFILDQIPLVHDDHAGLALAAILAAIFFVWSVTSSPAFPIGAPTIMSARAIAESDRTTGKWPSMPVVDPRLSADSGSVYQDLVCR